MALALAAALAVFGLLLLVLQGRLLHAPLAGDFYALFPHGLTVALFAPVFGLAVLALGMGVRRLLAQDIQAWRHARPQPVLEAAHDGACACAISTAATAMGCNNADDGFTLWRRRFHHFTFYGFMLCFAATSVATLYHYLLNLHAPYAVTSLPVLLGMRRRRGPADWPGRPAVAEPQAPSAARRRRAKTDGPRLHRPARADQPERPAAAGPGATPR